MSRQDGILRVVLTGKWFDMIERGESKGPNSEHRFLGSGNERDAYCWGDSLEVVE